MDIRHEGNCQANQETMRRRRSRKRNWEGRKRAFVAEWLSRSTFLVDRTNLAIWRRCRDDCSSHGTDGLAWWWIDKAQNVYNTYCQIDTISRYLPFSFDYPRSSIAMIKKIICWSAASQHLDIKWSRNHPPIFHHASLNDYRSKALAAHHTISV